MSKTPAKTGHGRFNLARPKVESGNSPDSEKVERGKGGKGKSKGLGENAREIRFSKHGCADLDKIK